MNKMNKIGGFTDLFIFMIFSFTILLICGIFIFIGGEVTTQVHETMDDMQFGSGNSTINGTQIVDQSLGKVNQAYQSLYWIAIFLMVGMVLSIFIGSYLVTTKPIFFIPYIFIVIIAILLSTGISNAYTDVTSNELLASTFSGFIGSNFIMYYLPIWVTAIGFIGGIIMFISMKAGQEVAYQ